MITNDKKLLNHIAHKTRLLPSNKQTEYFKKAFGIKRKVYNWTVETWERQYKNGEKPNIYAIKKEFNAIKHEKFPYIKEVSKFIPEYAILDAGKAYQNFFRGLKGKRKVGRPRFKSKKDTRGSFTMNAYGSIEPTNTHKLSKKFIVKADKPRYAKIPLLGTVKMAEPLRFKGNIKTATISYEQDKYYISYNMEITSDEYIATHPKPQANHAVGIDLGIKSLATLSSGFQIQSLKPLANASRKLKRLQRQLVKRQHPRTQEEKLKGVEKSNNYKKLEVKVSETHKKVANIRKDTVHKLTTHLVKFNDKIVVEDLNVGGMMRTKSLSKSLADVSLSEFKSVLSYKAENYGRELIIADRFYPSSKTCNQCGNVKKDLTLKDRVYVCDACGYTEDRDYNASLNLVKLAHDKIGQVQPELTPEDLTAMREDLLLNCLATSEVETGIQHKFVCKSYENLP